MGFTDRDGTLSVTVSDGPNWQAYRGVGAPAWDDSKEPLIDPVRLHSHDAVGSIPAVIWALVTQPGAGVYTLTDDAADKQQDLASSKLTADAAYPGGAIEIEAGLSTDLTGAGYLKLWIKSSAAATFQIRLKDTNGETATHTTTVTTTTSWAEYAFDIMGFLEANPLLDLDNLDSVRYTVNRAAGGATTWRFDDLRAYA